MRQVGNEKKILGIAIAISLFVVCITVATATEIVFNKTVPAADCSEADVRAIFTIKKTAWTNRKPIKVYTLPDNDPVHKEFVKSNLHMFVHQLRRIWDRITYSGTGTVPIELESEEEMLEKIATTPDSIGYLSSKPNNENIHTLGSW